MKRCFFVITVAFGCLSADANGVGNLVLPEAAIQADGFQRRMDEIARGKREVLRELIAFGDRAADSGTALTFDQWKSLAVEFAGGPMSSYIPDDKTLQMTLQQQIAKAVRKWK